MSDLCRKIGVSEGTFYRWKRKFAAMSRGVFALVGVRILRMPPLATGRPAPHATGPASQRVEFSAADVPCPRPAISVTCPVDGLPNSRGSSSRVEPRPPTSLPVQKVPGDSVV